VCVRDNDEMEFAETVLRLLEQPSKRMEMGRIGRKRVDEILNWEKQKVNLKEAYEYLLRS
jgi:glycosyltransferase involved in cell wall biosynthesis